MRGVATVFNPLAPQVHIYGVRSMAYGEMRYSLDALQHYVYFVNFRHSGTPPACLLEQIFIDPWITGGGGLNGD